MRNPLRSKEKRTSPKKHKNTRRAADVQRQLTATNTGPETVEQAQLEAERMLTRIR